MKYQEQKIVDAIYDETDEIHGANPFLEAMPEILSKAELFNKIKSFPIISEDSKLLSSKKRRGNISILSSIFIPMDYMYQIYDMAYRAIKTTYMTMNIIESTRQINALFPSSAGEITQKNYITQAECSSVLGVPGIGKTSTLRRCLSTMPQVILHNQYSGKMFYYKQITYLFIECPSDCSIKTLGYNIASAVDKAIGSHYVNNMLLNKTSSVGAIALMVKQICLNHHVGLVVIDEIQNAVQTAKETKQTNKLIKFLVELMNDTCTSILLVGTPEAEELFLKEEHLKRRTRGPRLLPIKNGAVYRAFIETMWSYQFTEKKSELTDKIANELYGYSGGVPAYIIKLYQEAQVQAILSGYEIIDSKTISSAAQLLTITAPQKYTTGTNISSFIVKDDRACEEKIVLIAEEKITTVSRGRRAEEREKNDLLVLTDNTSKTDIKKLLSEKNLLEEIILC